jgi:hypothetical protein
MAQLLKAATQGALHKSLQKRFLLVILAAVAFHIVRLQAEQGNFQSLTDAMGNAMQFIQAVGAMLH